MSNQSSASEKTGPKNVIAGDKYDLGVVNAEAIAVGTNSVVKMVKQGNIIESQTIVVEFGQYGPIALEVLVSSIVSHLGLERSSMQSVMRNQPPDHISRQIMELEKAEKEIADQGLPTTPKTAYDLAILATYRRDYEKAIAYFRMATDADPTFTKAHYAISWLQQSRAMHDFGRGDYDAALLKLDEAQEAAKAMDPKDARSFALQGFIAKTRAQIAENKADLTARNECLVEAENAFRAAAQIDPEDPAQLNGLGNVLYMRGKLDEAIDYFRRAILIAPHYTATFNDLALAFEGKMKEDPTHRTTWGNKAILAWEQVQDLAEQDPGFPPDYSQRVKSRIRGLKLQL